MDNYGLIGKNINYSFSKDYFTKKFTKEEIAAAYQNFDLDEIGGLFEIIRTEKLKGFNVTIPFKEKVIAFLDEIDPEAEKIGAVNTVKITNGKLIGYNTDSFGFVKSVFPLLEKQHRKALVLGTGGASKAIAHGLHGLGIQFEFVSRSPTEKGFTYEQLSQKIIAEHLLIINCTPLGTFPKIEENPKIPYQFLGKKHLLFDLVYNPPLSKFLAKGKQQGATICNGQKMLQFQAEKAWEIWRAK